MTRVDNEPMGMERRHGRKISHRYDRLLPTQSGPSHETRHAHLCDLAL